MNLLLKFYNLVVKFIYIVTKGVFKAYKSNYLLIKLAPNENK